MSRKTEGESDNKAADGTDYTEVFVLFAAMSYISA
jgi:hypothetical protein